MKVGFGGGIKLEFHGAKVTSDSGLLAYRDLYKNPWVIRFCLNSFYQ